MSKPPVAAILIPFAALGAMPASAQQAAADAGQSSFVGELMSIVIPLAFIVLVLFAVLRLAKRRFTATGQDAPLSVVQVLPLGPRERIVLLKSRTGRVFAVGVAGQSVNLITDLEPGDLAPAPVPANPGADAPDREKVFGLPLMPRDLFVSRRPKAHSAD
jgi:flagellar protein FliO/FliZ